MGASLLFLTLISRVVILSWFLASFSSSSEAKDFHRAFPILVPDSDHTKLRLAREGIEAIKRITSPVAAVAVIGPYRSGKSFLLNQLLSLSCDEGFGVSHIRDAKTKGLWVWGTPVELVIDESKVSVLYIDTEGFESVGKSNVYDDRIFALATVLSSLLIYNLPETVREADISRLSFAVEIAEEFYGRVKGKDVAFEPAKLIWLIQRDFLEGKSVEEMVNEALQPVPNSHGDKYIDQVNKIRKSLAIMGKNISAFSLPQPHLRRTKLCDMKDSQLDDLYVKNREQLKQLVQSITGPKIVQGKPLNGKEFVVFLEQIVEALNKGEIPSTGSIVEVFNKAILERCLKIYSQQMDILRLPVPDSKLQAAHTVSKSEAKKLLDQQHFGQHHVERSVLKLNDEMKKVYETYILANKYQSSKVCEARYTECQDRMDNLQAMYIPSMAKFNADILKCNQTFEGGCVGPSKEMYAKKLMKMLGKSRSLFIKDYYRKLSMILLVVSVIVIVVSLSIKFNLFVVGGFMMLILSLYLSIRTPITGSLELLYDNPAWQIVATAWETIVGLILVLERWAIPIILLLFVVLLCWKCHNRKKDGSRSLGKRKRKRSNHKRTKSGGEMIGTASSPKNLSFKN